MSTERFINIVDIYNLMVYTEIQRRNNKKYFYRVISIRKGDKVSKKRKYLGANLSLKNLTKKGKQKKNSDIDILIEPAKGMGLEFVGVKLELEDKLGRKVDLITYKGIHPLIKRNILKEEERII